MSSYDIYSNKVVLITGGTRGIGLSIAKYFLKNNAKVYITGTKKDNKYLKEFNYIKCDFLKKKEFESFLNKIKLLKIDILINNAGINKIDSFEKVKSEDFLKIHQVNTYSPFKLCQAVLPNMKINNWGRIINIASIWGKISKKYRASYSASKFGIDGITASLSAEVAKYGILVNTVSPGFIKTDLTKNILGISGMKKISATVPLQRLGNPEEVARFVLWLCSDQNTYISGQNIMIDGGFSRV